MEKTFELLDELTHNTVLAFVVTTIIYDERKKISLNTYEYDMPTTMNGTELNGFVNDRRCCFEGKKREGELTMKWILSMMTMGKLP
ncbi:hypothetical protein KIN20_002282 [Parelaphostrongylus tenuis]|uniref:Uncharacterized protein n=1 Tax=Parelaphostrongylus tenuis TaxID=148309 RepID=A0AAD5QHN6_PARTN|nr:hypothetical protein KIN20_002282 [Parelaphostrongylus tenuis]